MENLGFKEAYNLLIAPNDIAFQKNCILVDKVPTKVAFFAWEATWGKVLTLDRLQKRGWQLPNRCFMCGYEEETVNHILLHCIIVSPLGDYPCLAWHSVDVPKNSKRGVIWLKDPFVGKKKRKKIWNSIPLCIFLDNLKGNE